MKLARFLWNNTERCGIVDGGMIKIIKYDLLTSKELADEAVALSEVTLLAPTKPSKAVCIGLNYRAHAMELGYELPKNALMFLKPPSSVLDPNGAIVYPAITSDLHYEGELAVVIGKKASHVAAENAMEYILGYTCANDVTARDIQKADGQWTRGKSFDTFLPFGPWIETEFNLAGANIKTLLNGKVKQDSNINDLIFTVPQLIEQISAVMTLEPGDIILTGTPSGVGPMEVGDTVTIAIEGIGELTNTITK